MQSSQQRKDEISMGNQKGSSRGRIRRMMDRVASKLHFGASAANRDDVAPEPAPMARKATTPKEPSRGKRIQTDIPLEQLAQSYIPSQGASKAGFRATGRDQQSDQEFAIGVADDRFNAEDVFTNKSGDSRIGTHRRSYEPGERKEAR
jgi:hypothetical protein